MKELSVTVAFPGAREVTYRFRESPVRIGRSPECHLSVCHEAVPRELCSAWLEHGGKTVRVEERPNLTNPLLKGGNLVCGGVSGKNLELSVGPVRLGFSPVDIEADERKPSKKRGSKLILTAAAAAVFAGALLFSVDKEKAAGFGGMDSLPRDPFCGDIEDNCESSESCLERARLLSTRAKELESRADGDPAKKVLAAKMLGKADELYTAFEAQRGNAVTLDAQKARHDVMSAYRQDSVALRNALNQNAAPSSVKKRAVRLRGYLTDCSSEELRWLDNLIDGLETREK